MFKPIEHEEYAHKVAIPSELVPELISGVVPVKFTYHVEHKVLVNIEKVEEYKDTYNTFFDQEPAIFEDGILVKHAVNNHFLYGYGYYDSGNLCLLKDSIISQVVDMAGFAN